jgi:hypothetical protein
VIWPKHRRPERLDPALRARFDILVSIPGVAQTTASAMLVERPELGTIEHRCAAAPASRRSPAPPASAALPASSAAGAPIGATRPTCRRSSRYASTPP